MPEVKGLLEGKLPPQVLGAMLESIEKGASVVPASVGVDVGVTKTKGKYLISSSDPITGTEKNIGWHAVQVSANDVATSGIMPDCLSVVSMFPPKTHFSKIMGVMREISKTSNDLGITVVGGHTEITPGLKKPIVVVTCFGSGDRFVTSADASAEDVILMTKTAGIEGTSILANLAKVRSSLSTKVVSRASNLLKKLSIIPEARLAFSTGRVHAMHDVTEGGVIGAAFEMSFASSLGFELDSRAVPVDPATSAISRVLGIDPLRLIGSGSLLISCGKDSESTIKRTLARKRILCSKIGTFVPARRGRVLSGNGRTTVVTEDTIQDELWRIIQKNT